MGGTEHEGHAKRLVELGLGRALQQMPFAPRRKGSSALFRVRSSHVSYYSDREQNGAPRRTVEEGRYASGAYDTKRSTHTSPDAHELARLELSNIRNAGCRVTVRIRPFGNRALQYDGP